MTKPNNVSQLKDIAQIRKAQAIAAEFATQRAQAELRDAEAAVAELEAVRTESEMQWRQALQKPSLPIGSLMAWSAQIQQQGAKLGIAQREAMSKRHVADQAQSAWRICDVTGQRANAAVKRARGKIIDARDDSLLEDVLEKIAFGSARS